MSVSEILALHRIPGAQVLHRKGSETLLEVNQGMQAAAAADDTTACSPSEVTSASVFQAASLSKVISSYLFLRAVDSGVLDLDTALSSYVDSPRTRGSDAGRSITVRQVLNHTTGLPNWADGAGTENSVLDPASVPGSRFTYSGDGFFLLQQTLEALDGRPLEVMAQKELFEPWDMQDSSFTFRETDAVRTVSGHDADGACSGISRFTRANSAFTLTTSARDYTEFLRRAVIGGEGLRPATHAMWLSTSSDAVVPPDDGSGTPSVSWGLGVGLEKHPRGTVAWHWGDNGNHRAFFVAVPERDESVVMFFNSADGQRAASSILTELAPGQRFASLDWVDAYDRG